MAITKYDRELEKAKDDLALAEERLFDAEEVLTGLRRKRSQEESFNLPSLSALGGCALFYSSTGGTVLSQNGEEIVKWNYIPSLTELFEATA